MPRVRPLAMAWLAVTYLIVSLGTIGAAQTKKGASPPSSAYELAESVADALHRRNYLYHRVS